MKHNIIQKAVILFVLLLAYAVAFAGDNYNQTTTVAAEGATYVTYKVTGTMTDQTGNYYSKGLFIGDLNDQDGYIQVKLSDESGTEDVNVFLEYSFDGVTWTAGTTDSNLDQVGATVVNDTLGIANGVDQILFHNSNLLRVKLDGQTGNPATTFTVYVTLKKDPVYDRRPDNVARVVRY